MRSQANLRRVGFGLMALGCVLLVQNHLNADGRESDQAVEKSVVSGSSLHRVREGSRVVNQLGEFHDAGERIAFYPDGTKKPLLLLENLALERVSRDLEQGTRKWSVTGTITEYRGSNYLLIERALMKQRTEADAAAPRS